MYTRTSRSSIYTSFSDRFFNRSLENIVHSFRKIPFPSVLPWWKKKDKRRKENEHEGPLDLRVSYSLALNRMQRANRLPCSLSIRGRKRSSLWRLYTRVRVRGTPPIGVVVLLIFFALSRWIIERLSYVGDPAGTMCCPMTKARRTLGEENW